MAGEGKKKTGVREKEVEMELARGREKRVTKNARRSNNRTKETLRDI